MLLRSTIIGVQPRTGGEMLTESALAGLMVVAPLMFGSTEPWSFQVVVALAGIALAGACLDLALRRDKPVRWTWATVPIVVFLGLVAAQLVPLPAGVVAVLAPQTAEFWSAAGASGAVPLSLYPFETQRHLWLMLVIVAVFFAVVQTHRRPEQVQVLLIAILLGGAASVLLALGQNVVGSNESWGISPRGTTVGDQYLHPFSGPFLNHSHFAQHANLAIGACVALLLIQLNEVLDGGARRFWNRLGDVVRHRDLRVARIAVIVGLLAAVAIVLSLSRGGVLSMVVASGIVVAGLTLSSRHRGAGSIATLFGIVVLVVLLGIGIDVAAQRLITLRDFQDASGDRLTIVTDVLHAVRGFPLAGAGLGTFGVAFAPFDTSGSAAVATHAENEYAQLLFETGIIGVACLLGFVAVLVVAGWRCVSTLAKFRDAPTVRYAAFGIGYGIIAVAVHSLSDFGQHVPGIAVITAAMAGLLVALPTVRRSEKYGVSGTAKLAVPMRWGVLGVVVVVMCWAWWGTEQQRRAEATLVKATMLYGADRTAEEPLVADRAYAALILAGEKASRTTPGDAQLAYQLGALRYEALERSVDGEALRGASDILRRISGDLRAAHQRAPTYGPPLALAGGIEAFLLGEGSGVVAIRRARELTAYDAETNFVDARLTLEEGDTAAAVELFERAIRLERGRRRAVIDVLVGAGEFELAYGFAEGEGAMLEHLARRLERNADPDDAASWIRRARLEAQALLRAEVATTNASGNALRQVAEIEWTSGDRSAALDYMDRALGREPSNTRWRFRYAQMLHEQTRYSDAVEQLRLLLRLKPDDTAGQKLLDQVNRALIRQKAEERRQRREQAVERAGDRAAAEADPSEETDAETE